MKCPNCGGDCRTYNKRQPVGTKGISFRKKICQSCKLQFKTEEKIVFSSLPKAVRDIYLENGKVTQYHYTNF